MTVLQGQGHSFSHMIITHITGTTASATIHTSFWNTLMALVTGILVVIGSNPAQTELAANAQNYGKYRYFNKSIYRRYLFMMLVVQCETNEMSDVLGHGWAL